MGAILSLLFFVGLMDLLGHVFKGLCHLAVYLLIAFGILLLIGILGTIMHSAG